jgi:membrane-associated protease RseP (regulator of RpoE activity)
MQRKPIWRIVLAVIVGVALAGAAQADPGEKGEKGEKVEKRRIVFVGPDGEPQVIEGEGFKVRRGYLGVGLTELTPELRTHFGVAEDAGAMVSHVEAGSPADKAGIKVGDVLTAIDGNPVKSSWDLRSRVRRFEDGQQVPVELSRDGRAQTVTATIVHRERPELDLAPMFIKEGEGKSMVLRLNPEGKLLDVPRVLEGMEIPLGEGGPGPGVRIHRLREREAELEKRLKELEARLAELERQIEKKN